MANTRPPTMKYDELSDVNLKAEGGFGLIYTATHSCWGTVVYKQLKATIIAEGSREYSELQSEVRSFELKHENIVKLLAMVFEDGHYGIVMEFVKFGGLDHFLYQNKPVDLSLKLSFACGIVQGMKYLHSRTSPVVHGDLKVQNVLIDEGNIAKICDFGLSKWKEYSSSRTRSHGHRGTITHIPPEIFANINSPRTVKFDVYSFGILLWEMMTEELPFKYADPEQIKLAVKDGQRPDVDEIKAPSVTLQSKMRECVTTCWHQDPDSRPSFSDLEEQFAELVSINNRDFDDFSATDVNELNFSERVQISSPHHLQELRQFKFDGGVRGVTVLRNIIYVVHNESSKIATFDASTYQQLTDINVDGLRKPSDIVASTDDGCLYVADFNHAIWRVNITANSQLMCIRWLPRSAGDTLKVYTLAMTQRHLVVTLWSSCALHQYDQDRRLIALVRLPGHMVEVHHAVPWSQQAFVVCHCGTTNDKTQWAVSVVSSNGRVLRELDMRRLKLQWPQYLTPVDNDLSRLIIADWRGDRVLSLTNFQSDTDTRIADKIPLTRPHRVYHDQHACRLYVIHGNWPPQELTVICLE